MKKIPGVVIGCYFLLGVSDLVVAEQSTDFQQQLQRLQAAVTQARQANVPAPVTPGGPTPGNQTPQAAAVTTGLAQPAITGPSSPAQQIIIPGGAQPTPTTPPQLTQSVQPPVEAPATVVVPATPPTPAPTPTAVNVPVPGTAPPLPEAGVNLRDQAFSETADSLLPLTTDQIRTLHSLFSNTQRAVGEAPGVPPRPTSTSKIVNLAPGATPPIIRLSAGFVTSLVFLDASGSPWPIDAYDLGDPKSYNIQWDKKSNMLLIQAITEYKSGNLAVMLRGLNTPVMLTLLPGQRAVDYRVDLRIPGLGPNATPPTMPELLPGASNPLLLDVLNGVPPMGATTLKIAGRDCSVWLLNGKMYLRTRLTVLSPGWISTLSSADGMHAYEMVQTPVILASENGKMVKLTIQGL